MTQEGRQSMKAWPVGMEGGSGEGERDSDSEVSRLDGLWGTMESKITYLK